MKARKELKGTARIVLTGMSVLLAVAVAIGCFVPAAAAGEKFPRGDHPIPITYDPPTITKVWCPQANTGATTAGTVVDGTSFHAGATGKLDMGIVTIPATVQVVTSTRLSIIFDLTGAPLGAYDLTITNTDGQSATKVAGFRVLEPPAMTAISPTKINSGSIVTITGHGFGPKAAASYVLFTWSPSGSKSKTNSGVAAAWSENQIKVKVIFPAGQTKAKVQVVTVAGTSGYGWVYKK